MKLKNPFSDNTRNMYLGLWKCMKCGQNGMGRGGLELHHIMGRISSSPFNASVLCNECHSHIFHSLEEHRFLFLKNLEYLWSIDYKEDNNDIDFLYQNENLVRNLEKVV